MAFSEPSPSGTSGAKRGSFIWPFVCFAYAFLILVGGYFFSQRIGTDIDNMDRANLLARVQSIALTTNAADIAALTASDKDLSSPSYLRTKDWLYNLHNINSGVRFLYFMRSNKPQDKLVFLVDSENPESKDYSPPGQVYNDTSPLELKNYIDAVPFTEGPYTDQWGSWVSGYAPIWWDGKLVGIFGMDVTAKNWEAQSHVSSRAILVISILASLGFVLIGLYVRRSILCTEQINLLKNHDHQ